VTFSLLLTNTSGSPIWEVRISVPDGFQVLEILPPQDWGYAVEENSIVYQALADFALIPENGKKEFEFILQTPVLGQAAEKKFKIQISARNIREEMMEENLWLLVDNLPPTFKIQPEILGCGEVKLEILASERVGNLSACLLLENSRIPLQLSTRDGITFEALLATRPGMEKEASLVIENAWDLAGNRPIESVLFLKIDTVPPRVENCWLEKEGKIIAIGWPADGMRIKGVEEENLLVVRTLERKPEILIYLSDGSDVQNWELKVSPDFSREEIFENGILKVIPKAELSGSYTFFLTVRDGATPPNEIHRAIWLNVLEEESYFWVMMLYVFWAAVEASLCYWAWKRQVSSVFEKEVRQIPKSKFHSIIGILSSLISLFALLDSLRFTPSSFCIVGSVTALFMGFYARSRWSMVLALGALGNSLPHIHLGFLLVREVLGLIAIYIAGRKPELTGWMSVLVGLWSLQIGFPFFLTGAALVLGTFATRKKDRLGRVGIFLGISSFFSWFIHGLILAP
jgi:hypothetical protein